MVDLKDTELSNRYNDSSIQNNVAELNKYSRALRERQRKLIYRRFIKGQMTERKVLHCLNILKTGIV